MTTELKMKLVAILSSATSLSENRVYDLADCIIAALPKVWAKVTAHMMTDALEAYLRVCRSGGMPKEDSDQVSASFAEMLELGYMNAALAASQMQAKVSDDFKVNGVPLYDVSLDWVCSYLTAETAFDGAEILAGWNELKRRAQLASIQPATQQEPAARLMHRIGHVGNRTYEPRTVARTYVECGENAYPKDWEEGAKLYTALPTLTHEHIIKLGKQHGIEHVSGLIAFTNAVLAGPHANKEPT